jgi:hypothetical protein
MDNLWKFNQEFGAISYEDYEIKYDYLTEDMEP